MGIKHYIELPDGRRWAVVAEIEEIGNFTIYRESNSPFSKGLNTHAQVVVPIEGIYDMTDEEIGQQVRAFVFHARACLAEHHAENVIHGRADLYRKWQEYSPYVQRIKPLLHEFEGYVFDSAAGSKSHQASHALHIIEKWEKHVERKQKGQVAKRYERGKASKDYDSLFIAIGRRDGFKCAACGSVDNLQLDHIEPVTFGGETKPENLQILCSSCNGRKGERTIDYRGTLQADETQ